MQTFTMVQMICVLYTRVYVCYPFVFGAIKRLNKLILGNKVLFITSRLIKYMQGGSFVTKYQEKDEVLRTFKVREKLRCLHHVTPCSIRNWENRNQISIVL